MTSIAEQTRTTVVYVSPPTWDTGSFELIYRSRLYCCPDASHVPDVWNWARLALAPSGGVTRITVWGPRDSSGWQQVWVCPYGEPPLPIETAKALAVIRADVSGENTGLWRHSDTKLVLEEVLE